MSVDLNSGQPGAGELTDNTGNYDIALDPGDYKLAFYDPAGAHRFEWHDNQPASGLGSAATVTATAGTPTGIDAALTPAAAETRQLRRPHPTGSPDGNTGRRRIDTAISFLLPRSPRGDRHAHRRRRSPAAGSGPDPAPRARAVLVRWLIDEVLPPTTADELDQRGHDAVAVVKIGLSAVPMTRCTSVRSTRTASS